MSDYGYGILPNNANAQRRARDVARIDSMIGKTYTVSGFLQISSPGEGLFDIDFPVTFVEVPVMAGGGHLADNEVLEAGNFPILNLMVKSFAFKEPVPGTRFYTGATLIIVATGHDTMHAIGHYQFTGRALVNPTGAVGGGLGF